MIGTANKLFEFFFNSYKNNVNPNSYAINEPI